MGTLGLRCLESPKETIGKASGMHDMYTSAISSSYTLATGTHTVLRARCVMQWCQVCQGSLVRLSVCCVVIHMIMAKRLALGTQVPILSKCAMFSCHAHALARSGTLCPPSTAQQPDMHATPLHAHHLADSTHQIGSACAR